MTATTTTRTEMVLAAARANRTAATELEVERLLLAVDWAELHPGDDVDESVPWAERELEIAGDGAPTVAEFSIPEFALAVGLSTDQGVQYVGDAVELCHRLPRTWHRVLAGEVVVWKARKVAQQTRNLPLDAALFVDQALAPVLHRCSFAQIERTVEAARAEFDPQAAEERRIAAAEERHFDVHLHQVSTGLVDVTATMDLADALTLEETIAAKAATLDPTLPLDVRRSMAAGLLGGNGIQREIVIHTHAQADTEMVEVENTRSTVTPEQVREWCQQAGTTVTVRPVLDLNANLRTDSYTPTERQQEQITLTHPRCVFPGCCRPSRRADADHITEYPTGITESCNLAPLCRYHHRLKTFTAWTYRRITPRTFEWTSPHGQTYLVETDRHIR